METELEETYTITFSEAIVTHAGMKTIGHKLKKGFSVDDVKISEEIFKKAGAKTELYDLLDLLSDSDIEDMDDFPTDLDANILVIRNGVDYLLDDGDTIDDFLKEQKSLTPDDKAKMRGKVVNKRARTNLCFSTFSQKSDVQNGIGTVIDFKDIHYTNCIRNNLPKFFTDKAANLNAELNKYYDIGKCSIGFHSDLERVIVIGVRVGNHNKSFPLFYQWYQHHNKIGSMKQIDLYSGDVYIMSHKATGNDGRRSLIPTLKHAAGMKKTLKL